MSLIASIKSLCSRLVGQDESPLAVAPSVTLTPVVELPAPVAAMPMPMDLPLLAAIPLARRRGAPAAGSMQFQSFLGTLNWRNTPRPPPLGVRPLAAVLADCFAPPAAAASTMPESLQMPASEALEERQGAALVDVFDDWTDVVTPSAGDPMSAPVGVLSLPPHPTDRPPVVAGLGSLTFTSVLASVAWQGAPPEPVAPPLPRTSETETILTERAAKYLDAPKPPVAPAPPVVAPPVVAVEPAPPAPASAVTDTSQLQTSIPANSKLVFNGVRKGGDFDIPEMLARYMLEQTNAGGASNRDVVRPFISSRDITQHPAGQWIVDFGVYVSERQARRYEAPFAHVEQQVFPKRRNVKADDTWWLLSAPLPALRAAIDPLSRYLVMPKSKDLTVAVWAKPPCLPDQNLVVVASDQDALFAILNARPHRLWHAHIGGAYSSTKHFETYPLPADLDALEQTVAEPAAALQALMATHLAPGAATVAIGKWLAKPDTERDAILTTLDHAVLAAYGLPPDATDAAIIAALLAHKTTLLRQP